MDSYDLSQTVRNQQHILNLRKAFHKWANLSVYFTLGRAKDNSGLFDLRYEGQSVGSVSVTKNGVRLIVDDDQYKNNTNEKIFTGYVCFVSLTTYAQNITETTQTDSLVTFKN